MLKTGTHPFVSQLKLFFKWGIQFDEANPYSLADQGARKVEYANKAQIEAAIIARFPEIVVEIPEPKPAPQPGPQRRPPQKEVKA